VNAIPEVALRRPPPPSALFHSTHAALTFAYNFVAQPPPGFLGRMVKTVATGSGKGLVGLDGAGQAGMILAEVQALGPVLEHLLIARFAPRAMPCACRAPCCSGSTRTARWEQAIGALTEEVFSCLPECRNNQRLRRGIICRYFGERVTMGELAEYASCNRDTAADQNSRIAGWLRKEEARALHAIDGALHAAGLIER
jgi:hypothetical protein